VATRDAKIFQLKITLKYLRPPIWRRVQVSGDITLAELHLILQAAMGWYNSHLHQFRAGKTYYGAPSIDEFSDLNLKDGRKARLGSILKKPEQKMVYEYDFGDGWEHEILLEQVLPPDSAVRYPRCLGGARACPPEDCGGVGGYANFLQAISDPEHEEHEEYLEWIGGNFDPEKFDVDNFENALEDMLEVSDE
jgi:Plasmid pRiA4b ORF-3-like protein